MTSTSVRLALVAAILSLASLPHPAAAAAPKADSGFALRDGDRVVFFGDSITEQRLYTTYVEHFVVARYPDLKVTFVNSGWGGDQTAVNECEQCHGVGALPRIERDVVAKRPTVVTLLFGMNDGKYKDFDQAAFDAYERGMAEIVRIIKTETKARIYVMTPTVYDGTRKTPWSHTDKYNDVLDRYSAAAKALAARENLRVIDLHAATTEALARAKGAEADYTFAPDGVHPNEDGQLVMATAILKAWGAEPARVTAKSGTTFDVDAPLPWPSPAPSARLAAAAPEIAELGAVTLSVPGLAPGTYGVTVDGADAGTYTAEQLAAGVDVFSNDQKAVAATDAVAKLVRARTDALFVGWRELQVPLGTSYRSTPAVLDALDKVADEMAERERAEARPRRVRLVLTKR